MTNETKKTLEEKIETVVFTGYEPEDSSRSEWYTQSEIENSLKNGMDFMAKAYVETGSKADYVALKSGVLADIIFSSQSFFDNYAQEAFKKAGIENIKITGVCGGNVNDRINPNAKRIYFDFYKNGCYDPALLAVPLLYHIERG